MGLTILLSLAGCALLFLGIWGVIKAFDIGALDYFLLTKTHFF